MGRLAGDGAGCDAGMDDDSTATSLGPVGSTIDRAGSAFSNTPSTGSGETDRKTTAGAILLDDFDPLCSWQACVQFQAAVTRRWASRDGCRREAVTTERHRRWACRFTR